MCRKQSKATHIHQQKFYLTIHIRRQMRMQIKVIEYMNQSEATENQSQYLEKRPQAEYKKRSALTWYISLNKAVKKLLS